MKAFLILCAVLALVSAAEKKVGDKKVADKKENKDDRGKRSWYGADLGRWGTNGVYDSGVYSSGLYGVGSNQFRSGWGSNLGTGFGSAYSSGLAAAVPVNSYSSYSAPSTAYSYSAPSAGYSYSAPSAGYSYSAPSAGYSYSAPSAGYSYSAPSAGYSYSAPSAGYSYSAPSSYSFSAPSTGYTYPVSTGYNYALPATSYSVPSTSFSAYNAVPAVRYSVNPTYSAPSVAIAPSVGYTLPTKTYVEPVKPTSQVVDIQKVVNVQREITVPQVVQVQKVVTEPKLVQVKKVVSEPRLVTEQQVVPVNSYSGGLNYGTYSNRFGSDVISSASTAGGASATAYNAGAVAASSVNDYSSGVSSTVAPLKCAGCLDSKSVAGSSSSWSSANSGAY